MYGEKRIGNGQSICSGCLARGRQPLHWTDFLTRVYYDDGKTKIGDYCSDCLKEVSKYQPVKMIDLQSK